MKKALYVHVPFCNSICAYCDFMRCGYHAPLADQWLQAIHRECQQKTMDGVSTLYIGGGTPSSLSKSQLTQLLTILQPYAEDVIEYTMEANADSLSEDLMEVLKTFHVNRISLGAQTFQTDLLQLIQRKADRTMIQSCIASLHEHGIHNISIDLMYGLPTQSMKSWMEDLEIAVQLPITHISLYALTIEEHSKFGREQVSPCDENLEADFYEYAIAYLTKHGFEHYEISNFAKPGYRSNHNMAYWHYNDFYGIGCGASGKEAHVRYENTRNLHTYVTQGACPQTTPLSLQDEMFETIMMGLRVVDGVSEEAFRQRYQCSLQEVYADAIAKHIQRGNLIFEQGSLRTTYQGRMLLHEVLLDFLDA